jgi:hypothetical protein
MLAAFATALAWLGIIKQVPFHECDALGHSVVDLFLFWRMK